MRAIRSLLAIAGGLALVSAAAINASADSRRDRLVVSTAWLAEHLADADLVLLHVGEKAEYDARHIPGARHVAFNVDLAASDRSENGLMLQMLPADVLRDRLAALGISDNSRVVVYYGKDWVSPATRVIATLDYAGLGSNTSLLDGGMGAWVRDGHDVTDVVPAAKAGTLSALKTQPTVVDAEYVRSQLGVANVAIVDARAPAFFDGTQTGGPKERPHRTGHIPGARSVPFSTLTNDSLMLRSADELAAAFAAAGIKPGDTVITYCHIGQQATAALFAARLLGHKALLYDGSFEDWSRRADFPVENPAAKQ